MEPKGVAVLLKCTGLSESSWMLVLTFPKRCSTATHAPSRHGRTTLFPAKRRWSIPNPGSWGSCWPALPKGVCVNHNWTAASSLDAILFLPYFLNQDLFFSSFASLTLSARVAKLHPFFLPVKSNGPSVYSGHRRDSSLSKPAEWMGREPTMYIRYCITNAVGMCTCVCRI